MRLHCSVVRIACGAKIFTRMLAWKPNRADGTASMNAYCLPTRGYTVFTRGVDQLIVLRKSNSASAKCRLQLVIA